MEKESDKGPFIAQGAADAVPCDLHQVWLGGQPLPPIVGALVDGAQGRAARAGWLYRRWGEADMARVFPGDWPRLFSQCCHLSQASDVARYLILAELGGLYLDIDVELFSLPDAWWSGAWVAGTSAGPVQELNTCCLAAPPGHPFVLRMLEAVKGGEVDLSKNLSAGPWLAKAKMGPDVNVWPPHVWHGRRGRPGVLGHHYGWGAALKSYVRHHRMPPTT